MRVVSGLWPCNTLRIMMLIVIAFYLPSEVHRPHCLGPNLGSLISKEMNTEMTLNVNFAFPTHHLLWHL